MKNPAPRSPAQPSENDIRDYAYLLYTQTDGSPGHDLEHWYEATKLLKAQIPPQWTGRHHHSPIHPGTP